MIDQFRRWGAVLLLVTLAGCTQDKPSATPGSAPAASSAAAPSSPDAPSPVGPSGPTPPSPSAAPGSSDPAGSGFNGLQLVRTGGIAGITETITVKADGTWEKDTSKGAKDSGKLDIGDLGKLTGLASDPRIKTESDRKETTGRCNDTYIYLLIVNYQMVRYDTCPSAGTPPPLTKEIVGLVQSATT
ncbi:hypothetical protein [Paractinoplanes durhamensis]|nr:hypothetical protein [Actinoplanes durhamensis]